jgi:hypothetical protein
MSKEHKESQSGAESLGPTPPKPLSKKAQHLAKIKELKDHKLHVHEAELALAKHQAETLLDLDRRVRSLEILIEKKANSWFPS